MRAVGLPVPVVVVGNLTVGGTGKTPLVVWLAKQLAARGWSPGIVCRGYGGAAKTWPQRVEPHSAPALVGDEPVLIAARTGRPVYAGPDRVAAARALIAEGGVDVVLSDDGLQHYRLARAFEIAVVDGTRGVGNGWCLPAGPLREPPSRLRNVDAVVVNLGGADASGAADLGRLDAALREARPAADDALAPGVESANLYSMRLAVCGVYRIADGTAAELADFAGRPVHAVAGIGHPERFFRTLEAAGLTVRRHPLPDHAPIAQADLPAGDGVPVLVTEKDAVKCRDFDRDDLWCVSVEAIIDEPEGAKLVKAIEAALQEREQERNEPSKERIEQRR